ncbi:alanine dehydrogenase [bacterium]|nr:alanine dehydrogenase [bacterium]
MIIGLPKEIKPCEYRVGLTPDGVKRLVHFGHEVLVQEGAGVSAGFEDSQYLNAGAKLIERASEVWENADLIVKVKEPQPSEYTLLKKNQVLFSYLHLAIESELTEVLLEKKITAISYETIQTDDGALPLLIPMSEIAGKMSVQIAASLLEKNNKGKGILLGGVPGVERGKIVILGAGHVGISAAKIAVGLGADVSVLDINIKKLRYIEELLGSGIKTYLATKENISKLTKDADALIGAVLVAGAKTPCLVGEDIVKNMPQGSVIIDLSINQGGIVETMDRYTTLDNPTFVKHGVIHYSVDNISSAVARTSTLALTNETQRYLEALVNKGIIEAIKSDSSIARGVNTFRGKLTNEAVAQSLDEEFTHLTELTGF